MLNHGILDLIHLLLLKKNEKVIEEALFMLSTIAVGDTSHVGRVLEY
jgi:hypothetical protein